MKEIQSLVVLGQVAVECAASHQRTSWLQRVGQTTSSRSRAGDGGASTDGGGGQGSGKKKKISISPLGGRGEILHEKLHINREDLWELQKILDGKKGSLKKTYTCQTGANDTVWDLNRKTARALETLALLYTRFEQVNCDLAKVDEDFDKGVFTDAGRDGKSQRSPTIRDFYEAEEALNEGLGLHTQDD